MSRIFLSHSSADNVEASALRDWLAGQGWDDVFLDLDPDRGIAAGERWERALHAAALRCEAVVFLISANWLASGWCLKEYILARNLNKKLFAVLVDPGKSIDELPPELRDTWQIVDLAHGQDHAVFRVSLAGSHEEKHVTFSQEGLRRLRRGLDKAGLDPKFFAWPPVGDPNRVPYRGLKPLEAEDAGIFFGRDAPIVGAIDRLRGLARAAPPRLLVVLGASGAGKSSFLRAGLLPRLSRDDTHFVALPVIRPGRRALTGDAGLLGALEAALPGRSRAELRDAVAGGAAGLRPLFSALVTERTSAVQAAGEGSSPPVIVLSIDQAEELLSADGTEEGAQLLKLLAELVATDAPAVLVLFTIRSDSYDSLERAPALEGLPQATLALLPMPRGAYKDVIEGPVRRLNEAGRQLLFEPQLTERLLEDIERGGGADSLPLLAFTLEQLYLEYGRGKGALRLADYAAFGGLTGAIRAAVERALVRADADPRIPRDRKAREALLRRGLIPWLAGIDPDTRSPRRARARRSDIPPEAAPLIDLLVEERLLATDTVSETDPVSGAETRVPVIEPAHEALLRQWGLLEGWLTEDFGLLAALEGVKRAARDWNANDRAVDWLSHQGDRLADAQALDTRPDIAANLDAVDRAYLAACRAREEEVRQEEEKRRREREEAQARRLADAEALASANRRTAQRTRLGLAVAVVLAIAAAGFGVFALQQQRAAVAEQLVAEQQRDAATAATKEAETQRNAADAATKEAETQRDAADKARQDAQTQRDAAQTAEQDAQTQRDAAQAATKDAQTQRDAAQAATKEAQDQQARAERVLAAATDTANSLVYDLAQKLRFVTGIPQSLVESILQQAQNLQKELVQSGETDPKLKLSQAAASSEMAKTLQMMGKFDDALASATQAVGIVNTLVQGAPDNASYQSALADGLEALGNTQLYVNDTKSSLSSYQQSVDIRRKLLAEQDDALNQLHLASSLSQKGDVEIEVEDSADALKDYQESLQIFSRVEGGNTDSDSLRDISAGYYRVAVAEAQQNDLDAAQRDIQTSLTMDRKMATDKGNAEAQNDLLLSLERSGDIAMQASKPAAAAPLYEEEVKVAKGLAWDKSNAGAQRDLAVAEAKAGDAEAATGNAKTAIAAYQQAMTILTGLNQTESDPINDQRDLKVTLGKIGDAKVALRDYAGALDAYQQSLTLGRSLDAAVPTTQTKEDLALSLEQVGDTKFDLNDLPGSLAAYTEEEGVYRGIIDDGSNAATLGYFATALHKLGNLRRLSGDSAGALAAYQEAVAPLQRLVDEKSSPSVPGALAGNLVVVGDVQQDLGQPGPAAASYAAALALVPDQPGAFFGRGRLEFYGGQNAAATADFAAAASKGASISPYPYYLMWLALARQQGGTPGDELGAAKPADWSKWPWPLVAVYRGQTTEKAALATAAAPDDARTRAQFTCEANFYLGANLLLHGNVEAAGPLLTAAAKTCPGNLIEHDAASQLLARTG